MMRWWTYQNERFPVFQHGLLVIAFSSSAVAFSSILCDTEPSWRAFFVAFITVFLFFLQLRIADEFKDAEEDAKYRPYRAVPRGLVSLRELAYVFVLAAFIQLAATLWLDTRLLILLFVTWTYIALMSVEFFARNWLKTRPVTYLWTHMIIMPLVDLFATSCLWLPNDLSPNKSGLLCFLIASFFNGIVIEIGRKLRQPQGEEDGVPTYSKLWGLKNASFIWLGCMFITALSATIAAYHIHFLFPAVFLLIPILFWALLAVKNFPLTSSKRFELISGAWTLILYLSLGLIPLIFS